MPRARQRLAVLLACAGAHAVLIALVVLVRHERPAEPQPMEVELVPPPSPPTERRKRTPRASTPIRRPPILHQPTRQISGPATSAPGAPPTAADLMAAPFADPLARKALKTTPPCVTLPDPNDWSVPLCPPQPIRRAPQRYETEATDQNDPVHERIRHNDEMRHYHEDWDGDRKYPGLRCALFDRRC